MAYYWLVIAFSCFGGVRLQYINGGDASEANPPNNYHNSPLPHTNYFNIPARNDFEYTKDIPIPAFDQFYHSGEGQSFDLKRNRRTIDGNGAEAADNFYLPRYEGDLARFIQNLSPISNMGEDNSTDGNYEKGLEKRNFSPWGGKRDAASLQHVWTWKRAANTREPNMPKRVRFSPWGGKRSEQIIYKSGTKGAKVIFATSVPELTRIVTNYSPNGGRMDLRGFQFVPARDKRHPIEILALSANDERTLREALPYRAFVESIPKFFKPGHTYTDVALKTDGKRKVKFSAWGGKRSPPIIGPIWTPAPQNVKESTLDTILVIRNNPERDHVITREH
ncbi:unnamed protein product, partial [Iphiclides podalirius]